MNTAGGIGMVLSVRKCLCAGKLDWRQSVWNVFASELVVRRGVQDGLWQRRRWAMRMKSLVSSCLLAISEPSARPAGPHGAGCLGGSSRARRRRRPDAFPLASASLSLWPPSTPFSNPCGLLGTAQAACSSERHESHKRYVLQERSLMRGLRRVCRQEYFSPGQ